MMGLRAGLLLVCCWVMSSGAAAQGTASVLPSPDALLPTTPVTWSLTQETWNLPAGETMGMTGGSLWWGVNERLKLGLASYGATRGERGGFITLGVASELQHRWSQDWSSTLGLYVGAGGGRGGQPLAGGGLMLRTDVGLAYDTQRWGRLGAGVSHVRFPDGTISSTQPFVRYDYSFNSLMVGGHLQSVSGSVNAGTIGVKPLATRGQEFALVARDMRLSAQAGASSGTRMQLLGVEWTADLDERWFLKLESEGAMGGQSSGYMQILAGGGYRLPVWQGGAVKIHAALGPAGGGAVDTRGGLIWDAGVALQQRMTRHDSLELAWGKVGGFSGHFKGDSLGLKWVHHFSHPEVGSEPVSALALAGLDAQNLRIRLAHQTYKGAATAWRTTYPGLAVSNLGVQLDYFMTPADQTTQWFVSGQGLAAYKGQAGAYMTGLVGGGVHRLLPGNWFAEAEALVGAGGGGGLATGGGLVGQFNAGLGHRLSKQLSIMATTGHIAALRGDFKAKVLGLALVYDLTTFAGR
ncbi:hypothetical protein [Limnohabitans sp.]|jgi:hypothetical protein|uniref:hypothetical protein n=1 Tax=Limnohabitans sp. TaxID=1907725 RepID=UPI00289862F8|nr:hypothetical protein [Limnohabitans sp.]